jgi:hypothetical protein
MLVVPDLRMPRDVDDTASFQRAYEKALGHNLLDPRDDERNQSIHVPAIGRDYLVSDNFGISISGDFSAPISLFAEGRGARIRNTDWTKDTLVIENTGGGNLRNWSVYGLTFVWGRSAVRLKKVHYGAISRTAAVQQWATAFDLETNGDAATVHFNEISIYEQRGDSVRWKSGKFRVNDLVAGEACGAFRGLGGELELNNARIFGTALNEIRGEFFPEQDPDANNSEWCKRNPDTGGALFALHGGAKLTVENSEIDTVAACRSLVYAERAGDIYLDANMKLAPETDTVITGGYLSGNTDDEMTWVNCRPLEIEADTYLYRSVKPAARSHRRFEGVVKSKNGASIMQDATAPVDVSRLDMIVSSSA